MEKAKKILSLFFLFALIVYFLPQIFPELLSVAERGLEVLSARIDYLIRMF